MKELVMGMYIKYRHKYVTGIVSHSITCRVDCW